MGCQHRHPISREAAKQKGFESLPFPVMISLLVDLSLSNSFIPRYLQSFGYFQKEL